MKILYICTHNRCRSILSEAITNQLAGDVLTARSAGSQPSGQVHPLSLQYLQEKGYSTDGLQSQSWDDFADFQADLVITVCDAAAGETCPVWFGNSIKAHWALVDPSKVAGSDAQKRSAFLTTIAEIEQRVAALAALARSAPDRAALRQGLLDMGVTLS